MTITPTGTCTACQNPDCPLPEIKTNFPDRCCRDFLLKPVAQPAPALVPASGTSAFSIQPLALTQGTWESARHWLLSAQRCEQLKLMCQVMLGFELQSLQKQHNIKPGNPSGANQHSKEEFSHRGKIPPSDPSDSSDLSDSSDKKPDWETILRRETGLSQSTAYRFIEMSRAAAPRLKKIPALKDFDPTAQTIAALPAPQQEALTKAVKKLTDGRTQKQFGEELGLWKKPQGSGATGRAPGEGGRKKLSLAEQAELLKLQAAEDWKSLDRGLTVYADKFTCLTDAEITAQTAVLERALKARKAWLNQPANARDAKAIAQLFA